MRWGVDTKPHTETVTRPSDTDNMEEILQGLEAELEVTTEEGVHQGAPPGPHQRPGDH